MDEPRFLFILTLPYSGSTALAKVLNSSPASMLLNFRAEGQWMVPAMCGQDRWNPDMHIDWSTVRHAWLERYRLLETHEGPFDVVIEKSPPHMVRVRQLLSAFPGAACFAFNRDPYANCASVLYRLYSPDTLDSAGRRKALTDITASWVARSELLRSATEDLDLLYFSYETFCAESKKCVERVMEICPELVSVDCSRQISVKDYPAQGIRNQNPRQVGLLAREDIAAVSNTLARHPGLIDYFGYSLL